ncbi:MAG TPA: hypothetical protein VGE18_03115 [Candidatus Paceibacterota bacterium]
MDNTTLGHTSFEHIPHEVLHPKRKTNRLWTLVLILIILGLFGTFWYIKRDEIMATPAAVVSVSPATATESPSVTDLESDLANTTIADFHEVL